MTTNFPYISADYYSEKFKPRDLILQKETIKKTEAKTYRDEIEFLYIYEGVGKIEINEQLFDVKIGDLLQLMPYHVHRFIMEHDECISLYKVRFSIGLLLLTSTNTSLYLQSIKNIEKTLPISSLSQRSQRQMEFLCEEIYIEKQENHNQELDALHLSLIAFLSYVYQKNQRPLEKIMTQRTFSWSVLQYIQVHHQEHLTIKDVSNKFNVEVDQIKHVLKELTGSSFSTILNQVRVRNAAALMQFDDLSVNQIGKICGYQTEANFYKNFKKLYGVTPLDYRSAPFGESTNTYSSDAWEIAVYLLEHCRDELTLEKVSRILNIPQKQISHLIKETFHLTYKELLNSLRVQIGKTLLHSLSYSIQDVSMLVGFSDATTFSRNFKKIYGITPKKWSTSFEEDG